MKKIKLYHKHKVDINTYQLNKKGIHKWKEMDNANISICIECDPPFISKNDRLNYVNIKDHIIKTSLNWAPFVGKKSVFVLCLCSSAISQKEFEKIIPIVDYMLLLIRQIYNINFVKNYLISPRGFKGNLTESGNKRTINDEESIRDFWLSTRSSETHRYFKRYYEHEKEKNSFNAYLSEFIFMK
nr:MAG: hypothetical protein [Metapenaeopsis lamellata majanivirus]